MKGVSNSFIGVACSNLIDFGNVAESFPLVMPCLDQVWSLRTIMPSIRHHDKEFAVSAVLHVVQHKESD